MRREQAHKAAHGDLAVELREQLLRILGALLDTHLLLTSMNSSRPTFLLPVASRRAKTARALRPLGDDGSSFWFRCVGQHSSATAAFKARAPPATHGMTEASSAIYWFIHHVVKLNSGLSRHMSTIANTTTVSRCHRCNSNPICDAIAIANVATATEPMQR